MDKSTAAEIEIEVEKIKQNQDDYGVLLDHGTREVGGSIWLILKFADDDPGDPNYFDCYEVEDEGWCMAALGCSKSPSDQDLLDLLSHYEGNEIRNKWWNK